MIAPNGQTTFVQAATKQNTIQVQVQVQVQVQYNTSTIQYKYNTIQYNRTIIVPNGNKTFVQAATKQSGQKLLEGKRENDDNDDPTIYIQP